MSNFVIVGCQRSGTSLVELIINSHPDAIVVGEVVSYNLLELSNSDTRELWLNKYKVVGRKTGVKSVGYRVPVWTYNYTKMKEMMPGIKALFLFRGLKPIVASMLSLGDWVNNCAGEIERSIRGITDEKVREYFQQMESEARGNNVKFATLTAVIKQYLATEYVNAGIPTLNIVYEDLVSSPQDYIIGILGFLGLTWDDKVMNHHKLHDSQYNGIINSGTNPSRAIDKSSLEKWRKVLSEEDVNTIDDYAKQLNKDIP